MPTTNISYNPFTHIANGAKKVFKTNGINFLVLFVVQMVFGVVLAMLVVAFMHKLVGPTFDWQGLTAVLILSGVAAMIIGAIINLSISRLILTGVRQKPTSWVAAFNLALSRLGVTILLFLAGAAIVGLPMIVSALLSKVLDPVGALLGILAVLALTIAGIILIPTFLVIPYVLVEDEKPGGVASVFRQARAVAVQLTGRLWLLFLVIFVVAIIISALTGNNTTSVDSNGFTVGAGPTSNPLASLLTAIVAIAVNAGVAELYNQVAHTGTPPVTAGPSTASTPPTNPMPPVSSPPTQPPVPPTPPTGPVA